VEWPDGLSRISKLIPTASTCNDHPQYREILEYIANRYGVSRVIVSSLVGHSLDALRLNCATIEVLHDFYPAWPLLAIHPQAYLTDDGVDLDSAMQEHQLLPDFSGRDARAWMALGHRWRETAAENNVSLVAPSHSVAELLPRLGDEFSDLEASVIPHGISEPWGDLEWQPRPRSDGRLKLLIPGRIQQGKGKSLLLRALPELRRHARVCLLGCGKEGEDFFGLPDVDVVLNYKREELPQIIATMAPDAAALLSTVPETFSYMLSELRELHIPVIATRVGSFAERIEDGINGWLIDPDPDSLTEKAAWLVNNRDRLDAIRETLRDLPNRSASDMVADYQEIAVPLAEIEHDFVIDFPDRSQTGALASLAARQRRSIERLEHQLNRTQTDLDKRTQWAKERDRILKQEREDSARWVRKIEKTLERETDAHKQETDAHQHTREQLEDVNARYEAVLASSSWNITRPLRVARRFANNFVRARAWNPLRWPLLLSQFTRTVSTLGWRDAIMRTQNAQLLEAPRGIESSRFEEIGDPEPPARMPRAEQPMVSIIIPVHNQWTYTAACLRSIVEADCKAGFEVIVIDDASSDETGERLAGVRGIDAASNRKNLGFIGSCNRGAARANGDFIVLLNNDTQVMDGWLDHLLQTFRQFPDTGIAGSRLIYPDGSLQECGGIIFNDGSGWNYGRGDNPDRPEYQFVREVDYCSGACIMLRSEVFRELGGFDKEFAPAYYEDTDIAFRVREMGLKVRVQPASTVVHHEGVSSGTDISSGTKRYQAVNRKKFLKRWKDRLQDHPSPIVNREDRAEIRAACDHRLKGRVLIIDAYTPEPDQDSGSLRLRYLMECFLDLDYGVSFIPDNKSHARRYTADLQLSGVEAWYHPWLDSLHAWFSQNGPGFDYVIVCRHYVAINYINLIRRNCPDARFIFDTIDLHYLREQRLADLEDSLPLRRSAEQTKRSELSVIADADATLVVSPTEVELLAQDAPGEAVHVISNIHQVVGSQNPFNARKDIFFVGGFQHPPNIDAALWFCSSVWPLIQARLPDLKFHLIGSKAPEQIKALNGNGVVFHGFVPRLEPFLDGCRLAVAPLRYGAGVKGKVNLSMSRGQPVVATPAAVEGLFAHDGEDVLVASEAQAFADAVVRLYQDARLWNRLSANGVRNVEKYFSLDTARQNLRTVLSSLE
jgi:GT2 family glycosyltransferase